MGIAGNRIDFTACRLEFLIFLRQIFQLGGADEGEVSGIEEKDRPRAENILPGHGSELVVLKGLYAEIAYLPVDEGHVILREVKGSGRIPLGS